MNITIAAALTNPLMPYIQCPSMKALGLKLKPNSTGTYEVYQDGICINKNYEPKPYELKQAWTVVP